MPAEPDSQVDSESVRSWLTALDLLLAAESAARGLSRIQHGVAVVLADAAVESSVAIIASQGDKDVPERANFPELLSLAEEATGLSVSLRDRLRRLHRHRNLVLHLGGTVDERIATNGAKAARELVGHLASVVFGKGELPRGTGPATAVAALLDGYAPEISHALRDMDVKLAEADWKAACGAAAYALDMARARCQPPLLWSQARLGGARFDLDAERRERDQQNLIVANGLGVTVADYLRLRSVIGRTSGLRHTYPPTFYDVPDDPEPDATRRAATQVVEIIFRLWETGTMQSGTTAVYQMMTARGLIPDVFG